MTRQPDEDHDVIVYEYWGTWAIWVGDDLQGVGFTREATLERARDVAAVHHKPADRAVTIH